MAGKGKNNEHLALPSDLDRSLMQEMLDVVDQSVRVTLEKRRPFIVAEISRRLVGAKGQGAMASTTLEEAWDDIESLSRLRAIVGGRFQNLRDRWVAAGFPLKEHRGDKSEQGEINQDGWIELSNWIMKQGFECRLTPDRPGCLFQLRKAG